jgi:hypothetical protein
MHTTVNGPQIHILLKFFFLSHAVLLLQTADLQLAGRSGGMGKRPGDAAPPSPSSALELSLLDRQRTWYIKVWHTMIAGSLSHLKMLRIGHFLLP